MPKIINKVTGVAYPCTKEQLEIMRNNIVIARLFHYVDTEEPEEVTKLKNSPEPAANSRKGQKIKGTGPKP